MDDCAAWANVVSTYELEWMGNTGALGK
jgi:hypothetical protein